MTNKKHTMSLAGLAARLDQLEAEKQVRQTMTRYMSLCDHLNADTDLSVLMNLFTEDAVWLGLGSRYAKTFGTYTGKAEIEAMFSRYTVAPSHFKLNAHFLCNELIDVLDETASGSWMLIQPSTFSSGESRLSCARITSEFQCTEHGWKIRKFTTENLFSRPMSEPWDSETALDVPE